MPRISVSVTMWSVSPTSRAAELGRACGGRASARSPAATARSPRRRRPRRSRPGRTGWPGAGAAASSPSLSSSKPKCVQTKSNAPWPSGWMWRVDTLLTCCWRITLGKIVVITAVGPPHQGSGTMSRKRGSLSFMSALKLDTCVTCVGLAASAARRDHRRVAVVRVHHQLRLVVGAPEAEGHEPGVQQARVVRVLDVLLHQLPVARDALAVVAEDLELAAVEQAVEVAAGSSGRGSPRAARRRGRTTRTPRRRAPRP